jgi:uncharacterized protein YcfL
MLNASSIKRRLMLLPLVLLLTACSSQLTTLPVDSQPVRPAAIAEHARARGLTCEQACISLGEN